MSRGRYIFLSLVALCTADAAAAANNPSATAPTQTYRWVDDKGVVHYGDSIPSNTHSKSARCSMARGLR